MILKYRQGHRQSHHIKAVVWPTMYVKCSEDNERKKRKSTFWTTTLSFDANICINLILPETTFPGLHFCRWQYMGSSTNVRTVLSESRKRQPTLPSPKQILTQNGHSRSFKVIYFGIIEEPLRGYIAQYNKYCLRCEASEDTASERSENRNFGPPYSHLTPPLQRTPANIRIKLTLLGTRIPGLHFCRWQYGSIFMQILVVGSETHVWMQRSA